nr:MAG TPA: hypothetical protein [Caudoviricetes sp.]
MNLSDESFINSLSNHLINSFIYVYISCYENKMKTISCVERVFVTTCRGYPM